MRGNQQFEALEQLGPGDVLVLDRGYPASWLVAHLLERGIGFCMRCDKANGWVAMRTFVRSGVSDALVTLNAPCSFCGFWGNTVCFKSAATALRSPAFAA